MAGEFKINETWLSNKPVFKIEERLLFGFANEPNVAEVKWREIGRACTQCLRPYVTYKRKSKLRKVAYDSSNESRAVHENIGIAVTFAKMRED